MFSPGDSRNPHYFVCAGDGNKTCITVVSFEHIHVAHKPSRETRNGSVKVIGVGVVVGVSDNPLVEVVYTDTVQWVLLIIILAAIS